MSDGRLRADGRLTRTGVFVYRDASGHERREYRPPEEVFHEDSLASFSMAPVTDDHPPESVDASNARKYAVGSVGESLRRDGDHVAAALVVYDAATIAKMERGKVQLSCGYIADVADEPGVSPAGERYDAVQRNIRGNHVAIVDIGRAGPGACVRMDAAVMVAPEDGALPRGDAMNLEQALAALAATNEKLGAEKARADAAEAALADTKTRADKAEADRDVAAAELTKERQARKDADDSIAPRVRARVALETAALAVLGREAKLDALSDRDIRTAVVKKVDAVELGADRSDAYVEARFDSALERADKSVEVLADARGLVEIVHRGGGGDPGDAARSEMMKRHANAWKTAGAAGQQGG